MREAAADRVPRGRHAPPPAVRHERQRARLFAAAAHVFARRGYAEATAEAISRQAGMSKATFYEHFANKEECLLALFDAAADVIRSAVDEAPQLPGDTQERLRARIAGFLAIVEAFPDHARTLLTESLGAGPPGAARRDAILEDFAEFFLLENRRVHERDGVPLFRSREDAFAIVGAAVELVTRQLRTGRPERLTDVAPVIERLVLGLLEQSR